jgi:hypothetical protein
MLDPSDLLSFPGTLLLGVLRFLWWLAWDVCFQIVGWSVGWPVCRSVSLGRFPAEPFTELGGAEDFTALIVEVVGLLTLAATIWYLSGSWPL